MLIAVALGTVGLVIYLITGGVIEKFDDIVKPVKQENIV